MKTVIILSCVMLLAACRSAPKPKDKLPFYNTPDFTPVWLNPQDESYKTIHTIGPFSFTNQAGQTISNSNTRGKIYVANFFFTSCNAICPKMMDNLAKVQEAFVNDDRVRILSHSVTPRQDSVAALLSYANKHHIDSKRWWLLTGNKPAIYQLARQAYFADDETGFNKGVNEFLHTENFVLIDTKGRIRGVYNGTLALEVQNLVKHIKLLEAEI